MDFRLPKTEELVTLQASGLRVVTRKNRGFSESSGVIERHGKSTTTVGEFLMLNILGITLRLPCKRRRLGPVRPGRHEGLTSRLGPHAFSKVNNVFR
jgi:hypothetical protein